MKQIILHNLRPGYEYLLKMPSAPGALPEILIASDAPMQVIAGELFRNQEELDAVLLVHKAPEDD